MTKCHFTTKYYDYEKHSWVDFDCDEEPLASGFCIFHDKDYLQDKINYEEHKRKVQNRLKHRVNHAISNNEPLLCMGFQLPDFSLSDLDLSIRSKEFTGGICDDSDLILVARALLSLYISIVHSSLGEQISQLISKV